MLKLLIFGLLFIVCSLECVSGFALPFEGIYKLDIIHFNDFHARFEETSLNTSTCRMNDSSCLGGFPRLYHEIQVLKKEKPEAIILNAGDSFQGTYWYTLLKWNIMQKFMNLIPHDAHAIGNHEFDDGPEMLAKYLSALKAPVLAANMDTSKEPSLEGLYKPYIIVKRKGRKIGIIGLITVDTKKLSSAGNVEFTDPLEAAKRISQQLAEQGVDIVILLSHCGLEIDKQIARDYGKNIDIIIGGHTHSLMWNGEAPSGETVAGPYPLLVESADGQKHKILIVQTSAFTKYMGNLSVYFDFRGDYLKWDGGPIFLNRSIPEDEDIKAKLKPYAEKVHEAGNRILGNATTTLRFEDCVYGECALGNLLVDALNSYSKKKNTSQYEHLSFMQRGNIKSSLKEGRVTESDLFELLPFNDRVNTFELQGKYVLEALEKGVSSAWAYDPFKGPLVLQVSGLHVSYNLSNPEGERVISVDVIDGNDTKPFNKDHMYQVTVPTFLATGGDGFTMFTEGKNIQTIGRDYNIVAEYIMNNSPLNVTTDGRIKILQKKK